ncbi:MAG TPA: CocE/NonD family hydrolase [Solirubrobacteraceae bacterium]|nr:CocE/NonD family hydrolase [Solirubrobacteraceae bacterium]
MRSSDRGRLAAIAAGVAAMLVLLVFPALASAAKPASEPAPFGHACKAQDGVRFCPTEGLEQRVPSFDGVPIDVDVTLPASGKGPFPTIVMMHGWEGNKTAFESTTPAGDGNETFDYNNVYYAQHGFAVVNYSARGWGNSCGAPESRTEPGCKEGWVRLADQRYENHDTEYLLGLLADEKIVKPKSIGVTGISYGGGQSIELADLKNRVREPNGEYVPWTSPKGKKMEIKAAFPRWPWSDLVDALDPNGRFLDTEVAPPGQSYEPLGVEIQSYVSGLLAAGEATGYIAPTGADPEADLTKWFAVTNAGEPTNPEDEAIAHQIYDYHQGNGIPVAGKPAPMLLESGWTDALFPVSQSLRAYNAARADKGYAALMFGDLGHSPGANKENTDHAFNEEAAAFFASKLEHSGKAPKNGSVTTYTQTCPTAAPGGGPFTAKSWAKLHPHTVSFGAAAPQTFTSSGGNPTIAAEYDPIANSNACKEVKAEEEPGTANYTTTSDGFTLMGLPTVSGDFKVTGLYGEIVARLWDVLPSGQQRLISRGVYRLAEGQEGHISFQMHGNGYEFAAGDTVKLQLLGRDAPYYRASNGTFAIEAANLTVSLPTL